MNVVRTVNSPSAENEREDIWLEEKHWGHRLWDQQSPWLIFLEFLGVAESANREGHLFDFNHSQYSSSYYAYSRIHLRNVLFNDDQFLGKVDHDNQDSAVAWRQWLSWMKDAAKGLEPDERDFSFLRNRFERFHDFAQLVRALRSCAVEGETNKRWSSRFIFPFGPSALFEDLSIKPESTSREYINFGRSGELLYHMLARSSLRESLARLLPDRVFAPNKWNDLVQQLQPATASTATTKRGAATYLPYDVHPAFETLGEDWKALLELDLQGPDVIPHLVITGSFGLFLYHLNTSAYLLGRDRLAPIICEVVAPRRGLVREQSIENFEINSTLSLQAIDRLFNDIEALRDWTSSGQPGEILARRREILKREFNWEDEAGVSDPEALWRRFKEEAKERHRRHFGQVHRTYGRGVGLVSKRGTNRYRYAPTDSFLRALLFANVTRRMEFGEFLALLYARYGLIFGANEAEQVLNHEDMDKKPFQANSVRLEQRLSSLGLLKRLSDACAYVQNPYAE